jgi:tRNA nucleotidyltransferase (CCA-adding enzyme)
MKVEKSIEKISNYLNKHGAKAIIVGGSVRDYLLNKEPKDFDIEVYGISLEKLQDLLSRFGKVMIVGKSFGVLKLFLDDEVYDFSLPRREKKIASGHRGFEVICDENLEYKEAFKRRDFTINAIGYDIEKSSFIDVYGGIRDLEKRVLRVVDEKTFVEDPLRVYRAIQFVARFELEVEPKTKELLKLMVSRGDLEELPKERVFEEFKKLLLKAKKPSIGFNLLKEIGALKYFPELKAIVGVEQDLTYHPEGDVWTHTLKALDALEKKDLKLSLAVLCHDLGKAVTTEVIDGKITSRGHEEAGVDIAESFLRRLTDDKKLIEGVLPLVRWHFAPSAFYKQKAKNKAIRRLSTKVNIKELVEVAKADFFGRGTKEAKSGIFKAGEWLLKKAKELSVENSPPKPFVRGSDLIDMGLKPSPLFKKLLEEVYQKQLDGKIKSKEEALEFLKDVSKNYT